MNKPIVTGNKPKQVTLSKDEEYFFVSVGLMKVWPMPAVMMILINLRKMI